MIDTATVLRIVCACAVVGLMLYAFALIARHRMRATPISGGERLVSVIETTPLPQSGSLHVIKAGEHYHVIALASGNVSLIAQIDPPTVERCAAARSARARLWSSSLPTWVRRARSSRVFGSVENVRKRPHRIARDPTRWPGAEG